MIANDDIMVSRTNSLVYLGIAVVVAVVVFAAAVLLKPSGSYGLKVSMVPLGSYGPVLYPYQPISYRIIINNTGPAVQDMPFSLYLNGSSLGTYKVSIPAHETAMINGTYIFTSNGTYEFDAVADPGYLLNIANRSAATGTLVYKVSPPQRPNLYTFVPNNSTADTHSFTLFGKGAAIAVVLARAYNVSAFTPLLGQTGSIMSTLLVDLVSTGAINLINGISSSYTSGASAYGLWVQGTLNATSISTLLATYPFGSSKISIGNSTAFYSKVSNTTSICVFTSNGWTKLLEYYNASLPGTCASVASSTYLPALSNTISSKLASSGLGPYSSNFIYTNSTTEGVAIDYNVASGSIASINMFQNKYGNFATLLARTATANVTSLNETCNGLVYSNAATKTTICSVYVPAVQSGYGNESLIASTDIMRNYTASIYSFVNSTDALAAHYNAGALVSKLGINETSVQWQSAFRNSCSFFNLSIGCSVLSFNNTDNQAHINITNGLGSAIHINTLACYLAGLSENQTVNETIAAGASANANVTCSSSYIPVASAQTSYVLSMNYTEGGSYHEAYGALNATNLYLG